MLKKLARAAGGNAKKLARVAGGLAKKRQLAQRAGMLKKLARTAGWNAKYGFGDWRYRIRRVGVLASYRSLHRLFR